MKVNKITTITKNKFLRNHWARSVINVKENQSTNVNNGDTLTYRNFK